MLLRFLTLFIALFLMHLPVIWIFSQYDYYDESVGFIIKRSIGNMGYSITNCETTMLLTSHSHHLQCRSGMIKELVSWGFSTEAETQDKCMRTGNDTCNQHLNHESFD